MVRATALKKRYIAFMLKTTIQFDKEQLKHALYSEALKFFGEYTLSFTVIKLIEYDVKKEIAILRCSRDYYNKVLGFLALVNELNGKSARTIAIASSGTIAALKKRVEEKSNIFPNQS